MSRFYSYLRVLEEDALITDTGVRLNVDMASLLRSFEISGSSKRRTSEKAAEISEMVRISIVDGWRS